MDKELKKKSWLRKNYIKIILGAAFLAFVLIKVVFGDHSSKLRVEIEKISVEQVIHDTFQDYISINGVAEPIRTVSLLPLVGGQVEEKVLEEGDLVQEGDVILKMSNPDLEQMIIDLRSELEKERINLQQNIINEEKVRAGFKSQIRNMEFTINNEKRNFEEKKYEYEQGMIPKNTYLMAKESFEYTLERKDMLIENLQRDSMLSVLKIKQLRNNLQRNEDKFKIEKRKLDDLNVKAPVGGRLSSLNVELGGQLGKNTGIGYIRDLSSLKIVADIDEHYSRRVTQNLKATCTVENTLYNLYVDKVSLEVIQNRFQTELLFSDEMPDMIRVGQTYRVKLQLGESKEAILVPRGGFFQSTGGQWIFVVDESNEFAERRDIRIGRQNNEYYEVLDGLKPGERVVVSSYDNYGDVDKLIFKQ